MLFSGSPFLYRRRKTREVVVGDPARGGVIIGGNHPVVKQSMITCDTMDTAECVRQSLELAAAGCQITRITAPTIKDAANLKNIVAELRAKGCLTPIVADIHFKPEAALEAAQWVEMVRINPGNYADKKKFAVWDTPMANTTPNWRASRSNSRRWCCSAKSSAAPCASAPITAR